MKGISILGSTGSIGTNTLRVVDRFPERFRVVGLAAGRNLELVREQVERYRPSVVSVATPELAAELSSAVAELRASSAERGGRSGGPAGSRWRFTGASANPAGRRVTRKTRVAKRTAGALFG